MRISIVGSGYVGIITGFGFIKLGNKVAFVDVDSRKISLINDGESPIYEKGLEELMKEYKGKYYATNDYEEAIKSSEVTFICVGTPSKKDGSIDLTYIKEASKNVGEALKDKKDYHLVVIKSTVLPGTTEKIIKPIIEQYSNKIAFKEFGLAMNPEFLREGVALKDFLNPDRIIIGVNDEKSRRILEEMYSPFKAPKLIVDIKSAEMIKYVSNAFLAVKISFANEIGNICKKLGIDSWKVFEGVGLDHRISPHFFRTGIGFGGSCLPKDLKALIKKAEEINIESQILKAALKVNDIQPLELIELVKNHVNNLHGKKIGILGLAFKPDTDDIRESRAIQVIKELLKENVDIICYDPKAMNNFKRLYPQIQYAKSAEEVLNNTDMVLILTEWPEFEELDYTGKIIIDGRRIRKAEEIAKIYEGVCW